MLKKIIFLFLFFSILIQTSFAANVNVSVQVYSSQAFFTYNIHFNSSENFDSFAIEKPNDAKLIFAHINNNTLDYTTNGNQFIFAPINGTKDKTFQIQFSSNQIAQQIYQTDSFSTYQNFNFPIQKLKFNVIFKKDMPKPYQIFPRTYELINGKEYSWTLNNVGQNSFFLINFNTSDITPTQNNNLFFFWISLIIFIITIIGIFYYLRKSFLKSIEKIISKTKKEETIKIVHTENPNLETTEKINIIKTQEKEETFEEIIEKYLTKNEKEIILIIKENDGILQNEILNFAPHISKSNLSKIIKKLNNQHFINRIKVGKSNKIYLGTRFKKE